MSKEKKPINDSATKQPKEKKVEYWVDPQGNKVNVKYISKHVKERTVLVQNIMADAQKIRQIMSNFKEAVKMRVESFLEDTAGEYGENWKGNAILMNFSENQRISIKINRVMNFDERLMIAKQKLDRCLVNWTKEGRKEIAQLVGQAFDVDKKGNINRSKIISLFKIESNDSEWKEGIQLIKDSMVEETMKEYIMFQYRNEENGNWDNVILDFARL